MKIIIATDSYKGNLTSSEVAAAIEIGIHRVCPDAECVKIPMADGGEGTVQILVEALGGVFHEKEVQGPLGTIVTARYGILADKNTAVIEMAEASGLPLLKDVPADPFKASSYGTGELIVDALEKGARKLIIGLGGSATTDGGAGMAQALGARFFDCHGNVIKEKACGGMLDQIADIDMEHLHPAIKDTQITIASDVTNPLCGELGAAHVFGPQKGATLEMAGLLDANLRHLARVIGKTLNMDVINLPGAGAAGGMGAGLVAFAGGYIQGGVDIITKLTRLDHYMQGANLVITGEGRIDAQTAYGKVPTGVAKIANDHNVPVIAIGGDLSDDAHDLFDHGIDGLVSTTARVMTFKEAIHYAPSHVADATERAMRLLLIGKYI